MNSLKVLLFFTSLVILAVAEPPRRQSNFRTFARQEAAESDKPAEGYNYEKPQGERLRLSSKFTAFKKFGRQEETTSSSSSGYHYPKPDNGYGSPAEETTKQPESGYGAPEEADSTPPNDIDDATTTDAPSTDNPQAERLRGFNRKNARLTRLQKSQKLRTQIQPIKSLQIQQQQQQPVIYLVNPAADFAVQPQQFEYFYVLNK